MQNASAPHHSNQMHHKEPKSYLKLKNYGRRFIERPATTFSNYPVALFRPHINARSKMLTVDVRNEKHRHKRSMPPVAYSSRNNEGRVTDRTVPVATVKKLVTKKKARITGSRSRGNTYQRTPSPTKRQHAPYSEDGNQTGTSTSRQESQLLFCHLRGHCRSGAHLSKDAR